MRIASADHTNWRIRDLETSLRFYRDVLGLEPFGLEDYYQGKRNLVSIRVTDSFILHLRPDPDFQWSSGGGYDHLALVVEDIEPEALAEHLRTHGVEIERDRTSNGPMGAQGRGPALYVRDPDGYLLEFKFYPSS